jgi:hypothetical protein
MIRFLMIWFYKLSGRQVKHKKFLIKNINPTHKQFLLDILAKVKYLDWKFKFDALSFPSDEMVEDLKAGIYQHKIRLNILHYGHDTDPGKEQEKSWLTYCGCVVITEWTEKAILEAIYRTLIQKMRHETSELFMFEDKLIFHEHRAPKVSIPA